MKVTHKLVVTESAVEVREKMRQALLALGATAIAGEGDALQAELNSGRAAVGVEIDCEATVHGTQITLRTRDAGGRNEPARKVMREIQEQFWTKCGKSAHSNSAHSSPSRRKRKKPRFWEDPLTVAAIIAAVIAIACLILLR